MYLQLNKHVNSLVLLCFTAGGVTDFLYVFVPRGNLVKAVWIPSDMIVELQSPAVSNGPPERAKDFVMTSSLPLLMSIQTHLELTSH